MIQNINCDGAFVETGSSAFYPNDIIDLAILVPREKPDFVSIRAMVVRRTEKGVGLLFTKYSPDFYQQMGKLIDELLDRETSGSPARPSSAAGS